MAYQLTGVCRHPSSDLDGCDTLYKGAQSTRLSRIPVNMTGHQSGTEHSLWDWGMPVGRGRKQYRGDLQHPQSGLWLPAQNNQPGRDRKDTLQERTMFFSWHFEYFFFTYWTKWQTHRRIYNPVEITGVYPIITSCSTKRYCDTGQAQASLFTC